MSARRFCVGDNWHVLRLELYHIGLGWPKIHGRIYRLAKRSVRRRNHDERLFIKDTNVGLMRRLRAQAHRMAICGELSRI